MTGICLLCGFVTRDLDVLDEHTSRHERTSRRYHAQSLWRSYSWCPRCGANEGEPCRTWPGDYVTYDPHADRHRLAGVVVTPETWKARMFDRARRKDNVVAAAEAVVDEWATVTLPRFTAAERALTRAVYEHRLGEADMTARNQVEHPCGIKGEHIGTCEQCGATNVELGWAHLCRPCWEATVLADYYAGRGWQ